MTDIWLTLHTLPDGSATSVAVNRYLALTWGRENFAKLYRESVYGSKKDEALAWADEQIALRAAAVVGPPETQP